MAAAIPGALPGGEGEGRKRDKRAAGRRPGGDESEIRRNRLINDEAKWNDG